MSELLDHNPFEEEGPRDSGLDHSKVGRTGSRILSCGDASFSLHRFFKLLGCIKRFKELTGHNYLTFIEDDQMDVVFGWPGGKIRLQWFNDHFLLEFTDVSSSDYSILRDCFKDYWKKDRRSTKMIRNRLRISGGE